MKDHQTQLPNFRMLLDQLAGRAGSDRQAAGVLGVTQGSYSKWRRGIAFPEDEQAITIANYLQMPPSVVLLIVRADRTRSREARNVWLKIADQVSKGAMLALLSAAPFIAPSPAQAGFNNNGFGLSLNANTHCIRKRRRRSAFAAAIAALLSLSGCSGMFIDSHTAAPAGWPALRVVEHRVERTAMEARCGRWVPWYSSVFACAEWHFAAGECHVWITPDTARFVIEHELMHCRGHDHPGATTARDAWHAYSVSTMARAIGGGL